MTAPRRAQPVDPAELIAAHHALIGDLDSLVLALVRTSDRAGGKNSLLGIAHLDAASAVRRIVEEHR